MPLAHESGSGLFALIWLMTPQVSCCIPLFFNDCYDHLEARLGLSHRKIQSDKALNRGGGGSLLKVV